MVILIVDYQKISESIVGHCSILGDWTMIRGLGRVLNSDETRIS